MEFELAYQVTPQWYFQGGYTFIDSEITQTNRAGQKGNRLGDVPQHLANFWTRYQFGSGLIRGVSLSAGLKYVGSRPLNNTNEVQLSSYTILNLGASYALTENAELQLFVENALDDVYYSSNFGTVFPGTSRTIFGRITLSW